MYVCVVCVCPVQQSSRGMSCWQPSIFLCSASAVVKKIISFVSEEIAQRDKKFPDIAPSKSQGNNVSPHSSVRFVDDHGI